MAGPYGFWQVVHDDPQDCFVDVSGTGTNVSLRRAGFLCYAGDHFAHIRTASGRNPPTTSPPSAADRIHTFRTATGAAGIAAWRPAGTGWVAEHTIDMSPDPREVGAEFRYEAGVIDDQATVTGTRPDGTSFTETWRRLSGAGSSFLAGAWESNTDHDRWVLLVTAGHYAVVRQDVSRPVTTSSGDLTDEEILAVCDSHGSNAGAIVVTATSFDNHPFAATNAAGYDATKHPSFHLARAEADRLLIGFDNDGSDATPWSRIG